VYHGQQAIVATGAYQQPVVPGFAAKLGDDVVQLHSVAYRNPEQLAWLPRRLLGKSLHWWGDHLGLLTAPLEGSWRGRRTQRGDLLIGTSLHQLARRHGVRLLGRAVDGRTLRAEAIVWATGFRSDYSWIGAPVLDERGMPVHHRGVTGAAGLYVLGMHNQYSRGSSLLGFVRHDAWFIVDRVCQRLAATPRRP